MDDKERKETFAYKLGQFVGRAFVICVVACLVAICIAATINIITKLV